MFEFKDGIYMLSLLRCLKRKEILLENVQNFEFDKECKDVAGYKIKDRSDEFKESFTEPYQKLKKKIEDIHSTIFDAYYDFEFSKDEKEVIDNFLEYGSINSLDSINKLLNKLEERIGIKFNRPKTTTYEELKDIVNCNMREKLKDFWYIFWKNDKQKLYFNLSNKITSYNFKLDYGKNGCVEPKGNYLEVRNNVYDAIELMSQSTKLNSNFYVYRSIRESKSFNPEDKINNLLLGKSIIEKYLTLISTTWNLDFALKWSEANYCCLYVIEVPKDSNYLILKDSFDLSKDRDGKIISQNEITLGPGEIEFNEIKMTDVQYINYSGEIDNKAMFIFYGKYKSYSLQEFEENFNKLLCEEEKISEKLKPLLSEEKTSKFSTRSELKLESEGIWPSTKKRKYEEETEKAIEKERETEEEKEKEERKREARRKKFSQDFKMRNRLFK